MKNFVIINGVNSNTINGLGINELPPISKPSMRVLTEEIDGRDGDITTNLGYSAYDKTITIGLFGTGYDINNIISFFNGEGTITFSNEDDKYYKYKIINQIDYEALLKFKQATITFHCQPFKYPLTETPLEIEYDYIEQTGETLTLNNTGESILKLDLKGNTSQTGTPTPDSPIPINVVSGDNEIVVCGKNLLNISTLDNAGGSSLTTEIVGNTIELTQSGTSSWQFRKFMTDLDINDYKGKTLVISGISSNNTNIKIALYDSNKTLIGDLYNTLVIPNDTTASYIGIQLYQSNGTGISGTTTFTNLQVELGSTATSYEPYNGDTYELDLGVLGKNIFDGKVEQGAINSNAGQTYAQCKTSNATRIRTIDLIKLDTSKTYTISIKNGYSYVVQPFNNEGKLYDTGVGGYGQWKTTSFNITNVPYIALAFRNTSETNITPSEIDSLEVMLEVGTSASPYEKYNPFKMRGIGTYEDYFVRNSGKNLFDGTYVNAYTTAASPYTFSSSTTSRSGIVKVEPNTTYTISKEASNRFRIGEYSSQPEIGVSTATNFISTDGTTTYTLTTGSTTQYLAIQTTSEAQENVKMQVELGTQATIYEPFGKDMWCKYNAIGEVVLDGSEDFGYFSNYGGFRYINASMNTSSSNPSLDMKCTYFSVATSRGQGAGQVPIIRTYSSTSDSDRIFICDGTSDTDTFKTWLSTHNTTIYYKLATPYLSLIEDETLISQLDNIQNAMSYEGQTNVSQVNNDKPFIISAKALEKGSDEVVVNNIGNIYAKPLLALEGNGIVNIYLNNNQVLQANVEDKMNIDIDTLEAYNPDTSVLLNRQVIGNYNSMTIPSGESIIKIDGALDKATISNYTRWL